MNAIHSLYVMITLTVFMMACGMFAMYCLHKMIQTISMKFYK